MLKKVTYRLPEDIYETLRKLAFTSRKPQNELIIEALKLLFKTPGGKIK